MQKGKRELSGMIEMFSILIMEMIQGCISLSALIKLCVCGEGDMGVVIKGQLGGCS